MIKGIGIDIVEIDRIEKNIGNKRFIERILTDCERVHFEQLSSDRRRVEFVAGRFAAKEAYAKSLGTGLGQMVGFRDIEILANEKGAPEIRNKVNNLYKSFISISHSENYAIAQVVLEE